MIKVLRPRKISSADDRRRYPEEFDLHFTDEQLADIDAEAAELGISREELLEQYLSDILNQDSPGQAVAFLVAEGLRNFQVVTDQLAAVEARARERQDTHLLKIVQRLQTGAAAMLAAYSDAALMIAGEKDNRH